MQSKDHLEQGKKKEKREIKGLKESVFTVVCMISALYRNKAHLHYSHFSCWWFCVCVFERHYTVVLPSAVLWHLCVAISLLNSCLIIPNLREYSNKADNAFFHMILQS